jgi:hypothetical protein
MNRILWTIVLVCVSFVVAAQSPQLEYVTQLGGTVRALDAVDSMIVLGEGPRLVIVDATDLANPFEIGRSEPLPHVVVDVVVDGDVAYVAADTSGIYILSIQDPANPHVIGSMDTEDSALGLFLVDDLLFVADRGEGLSILSVADKTAPEQIGWIDTPGRADDVAVAGGYAYVADERGGLRVISIADPTSPEEVAALEALDGAVSLFVQDDVVYVVNQSDSFHAVSIADPRHPAQLASIETKYPVAATAVGAYAYISTNYRGTHVVSIADPANLVEVGSLDFTGSAFAEIDGALCMATTAYGLQILSLDDPAMPLAVGALDSAFYGVNVAATAEAVYVTDYYEGVRIVSVTDPTIPEEVGFFAFPEAGNLKLQGDRLYVCGYKELVVVDIADSTQPAELGRVSLPSRLSSVDVSGQYAYAITSRDGLQVISLDDPANPTIVGNLPVEGVGADIAVVGDLAYVLADGLHVVSIVDPLHPIEIGVLAGEHSSRSLLVVDDIVYFSEGSILRLISVADPAHPVEMGRKTFGLGADVAVGGGYAMVGLEWMGVLIVDVADLANLEVLSRFDTADRATSITILGDMVYVADQHGGLVVLRLEIAED